MQRKIAFEILGIGTVAVDDLLHVDRYPPPDQKQQVNRTVRQLGGLIGSALATASRLGARCAYAGVLGSDELSSSVKGGLEEVGVDCSRLIERTDARPVHSVIVVDEKARTRNIFFDLAGLQPLPAKAISKELIATSKVLLIDQFGTEGNVAAARLARELDIPVVADMEWPDAMQIDELMCVVDHLIVPHAFATDVTGEQDPIRAVVQLHDRQERVCTAVTCGRKGCYYLTVPGSPGVRHQPACPITAMDTTGCGDVFHGAYAVALASGCEVPACIIEATAAAAVYASRPSGWQHLPGRNETASVIERMRTKQSP